MMPSRCCGAVLCAQLVDAMAMTRAGCEAAQYERATWDTLGDPGQARDRWVTHALIDRVAAAVGRLQGCKPFAIDYSRADPLQPELRQCFEQIELYFDIDAPTPWNPPDKERLLKEAEPADDRAGYAYPNDPPARAVLDPADYEPREQTMNEIFDRMVESAVFMGGRPGMSTKGRIPTFLPAFQ